MTPQEMEAIVCSAQASPVELAECSLLYTEEVLKNPVFVNFSEEQKQEFFATLSPLAKLALVIADNSLSWVLDISQFDDLEMQVYRHSHFYLTDCLYSSGSCEFYAVYKRGSNVRYNSTASLKVCLEPDHQGEFLDILRAGDSLYPGNLDSGYFPEVFYFGNTFEKDNDEQELVHYVVVNGSDLSLMDDLDFHSLYEIMQSIGEVCLNLDQLLEILADAEGEEIDTLIEAMDAAINEDEDVDQSLANSLFNTSDFETVVSLLEELKDCIPDSIGTQARKELLENLDRFLDTEDGESLDATMVIPGDPMFDLLYSEGDDFRQFTWEISLLSLKNSSTGQTLSLIR